MPCMTAPSRAAAAAAAATSTASIGRSMSGCGTAERLGRPRRLESASCSAPSGSYASGAGPRLRRARGQRLAPLVVVPLLVVRELVVLRVVDDAELHAEQPQPLRDGVDRGGRDDEQPEDGQQHEQRYGEDLAHGVRQRGGRSPADEAARVPYGLHAVAAGGRAAGDVDLAEHADDERGQTDHDAAVGLGLLGVPDEADGDDREQYRHEQVEAAEGAGHQDLDEVADGAAQVRPGARGDDQCDAEQQQRDAVLAVCRVEVLGASALCRGTRRPRRARRRARGRARACRCPRWGWAPASAAARLLRRGFPGGRLLRRSLLRSGLLRRSLGGRLLRGLLLGCGGT